MRGAGRPAKLDRPGASGARTVWMMLVTTVATIVFGGAAIVGALLRVRKGEFYDGCARNWSKWILWAGGIPVVVEGAEHIPQDQPEIIVANHVSWLDIPAIATSVPKRTRFVAKKELESVPLFGMAMVRAGHISIDRQDRNSAIGSLDRAGAALRSDNSSIVIFAEGTRSTDGRLKPFKKGAFMLALHTGVNIVPTAVVGSFEALPKFHWRLLRRPIIVRFGEPIPVAGYGPDNRDELVARVRSRIAELLDEPGEPRRVAPESSSII